MKFGRLNVVKSPRKAIVNSSYNNKINKLAQKLNDRGSVYENAPVGRDSVKSTKQR